jgi:hypothetical protein
VFAYQHRMPKRRMVWRDDFLAAEKKWLMLSQE